MKKLTALLLFLPMLLALSACGKAYVPLPNPPLVLGEKYLLDLDYEQAILQFDQAIRIDPKNPRPYVDNTVAWVANPARPKDPPVWPKLPGLPDLPPLDDDPQPEAILPPIFDWYKRNDLLDFLRKLIEALLRQWPDAQWLKDELEKLDRAAEKATTTDAAPTKEDPKAKPPLVRMNTYWDGVLASYTTFEYNPDGMRKSYESRSINDDGVIRDTYEYNSDGTLKRVNFYRSDGGSGYSTNEYNANGTRKRTDGHIEDGSTYSIFYEYEADGKVIKETQTSNPGDAPYNSIKTYEYNGSGLLMRTDTQFSSGESSYTTYERNADGTVKRMERYHSNMASGYTVFEYNSDGTIKSESNYEMDGTPAAYNTYEYGTW